MSNLCQPAPTMSPALTPEARNLLPLAADRPRDVSDALLLIVQVMLRDLDALLAPISWRVPLEDSG